MSVTDDFEALRSEWTELATQAGTLFGTWEWVATWWRHFGAGRRLLLVTARQPSGELTAIMPLFLECEGRLRTIRFVGQGLSDELGPICSRGDQFIATQALRTALEQIVPAWDVFIGDALPAHQNWSALLEGTRIEHQASPVLDISGLTWEAFAAARSKNFRRWVRRVEGPLSALPDVNVRMTTPATLTEDFETLARLHNALWKEASSSLRGANRAFLAEFAGLALERGWLRLWLLEIDGNPVAAECTFRFADVVYAYSGGRDPAWSSFGLGSALLLHILRAAMDEDVREVRWLRGDEDYKSRFMSRDVGVERIAVTRGATGRGWLLARATRGAAKRTAGRAAKRLAGRRSPLSRAT